MNEALTVYQKAPSEVKGEAVAYYCGEYPGLLTADGRRMSEWELPHFDVGGFDEKTGKHTSYGRLTDFLNNDVGWLIVSGRIREVLEHEGLGPDYLQWLDVCLHVNDHEIVGEYFAANLLDVREAVHPTESTYLGPDRILTRFVLRRSALNGAALFRVKEMPRRVFATQKIKRAVDLASATGVEWWKIKVAD